MALDYSIYSTSKIDKNSIKKVLSDIGVTGDFEKTNGIVKHFSTTDPVPLTISIVDPYLRELDYTQNKIEKIMLSKMLLLLRLDKRLDYVATKRSLIEFLIGLTDFSENIIVIFNGDEIVLNSVKGKLKLSNSDFWDVSACQLIGKEFEKSDFQY